MDVFLDTEPNLAPAFQGGMHSGVFVKATLIRTAELGQVNERVGRDRLIRCLPLFQGDFDPCPRANGYHLRPLPAFDMAIATACFWGRPAATSVRMLDEIVFLLDPDLRGIFHFLCCDSDTVNILQEYQVAQVYLERHSGQLVPAFPEYPAFEAFRPVVFQIAFHRHFLQFAPWP